MQLDHQNHPETQEWLITYSDLMSLLLCFFVMLFAISTLRESQFHSATESLRGSFGFFGGQPLTFGSPSKSSGQPVGGKILFGLGSDDLSQEAKQELNEVYRQLLNTSAKVQIVGQAELGEPSAYRREMDLAYSRAVNVWDHLVSLGMDRERCQIVQQVEETSGSLVEIQFVR